jgi:diguanylate cyclase (GGDEF)-like protein/PAS domain S-box-containing protein
MAKNAARLAESSTMKKMLWLKNMTITWRLVLWFIVVALLPLALFGYLSLQNNEEALRNETLTRLALLADKKTQEIQTYLAERREDAWLLSRSKIIEDAMPVLLNAYWKYGSSSEEYQKSAKPFESSFAAYIGDGNSTLFYDIFLITPKGEIIFTYQHEKDFATNLISGPYSETGLARVFNQSRMTLESGISDVQKYAPSSSKAAFISVPIIRDDVLLGVLAFQLDTKRIYHVASDNVGLGKTGETVISTYYDEQHVMYIAPLQREVELETFKPRAFSKVPLPMRQALSGIKSGGIVKDYRGKEVVAAWRYLPEFRWGMVVKIDSDEVFAPLYQQRKNLLGILMALMVLAAVVSLFLARQLVTRIKRISSTTDEIALGDLSKRIKDAGSDEIGTLAENFNRMTENLQASYRLLESRVEERTRELQESNEQLQEEIIEREHIEKALRDAQEYLRIAATTFDTHEAILITDANANIIRVNQAFQDTTGYRAEEVIGKNPRILSSGRQDKAVYADMWQQLIANGTWSGELWDRHKDGHIYPKNLIITAVKNALGETTEYVSIFSDISERKRAEEEIHNLAYYDVLTKLPNRRLLLDRLHLALSASARSRLYGAVLFLDMDRFKMLNDTMGHDYGDLLLIEVAKRIRFCVREVDTAARFGGDEFVVMLEEIGKNVEEASQKVSLIAEKIRVALSVPYKIKDHEYHSSPSIGVNLYCGNERAVEDLLKHADMAMYEAKESGRNAVRFFDPVMQHLVSARASLEADLHCAVPDEQLQLYYQIQVDRNQQSIGAEALLRWNHPTRGMVPPAQFIPLSEESVLILEIGEWVLNAACRQLAIWSGSELTRHLTLAVNVSGQQFKQRDFVEKVAGILQLYQADASRLKLELTESVVLNDVTDVISKMQALKGLRVRLSMDDFGTGYSSLSYLKQLPLDQIKIDQSFVRDMASDQNDAVMVQTIIDMAKNFGLNVIAEGVETEAQKLLLEQLGCLNYQGYLFSKPLPIEQFELLLRAG